MKWLYRGFVAVLCAVLWLGIGGAARSIREVADIAPYRNCVSFPLFMQDTALYAWSLSDGVQAAELLVQNIGDETLRIVEITFLSYGKKLNFTATDIKPGEKRCLQEVTGASYDGVSPVICTEFRLLAGDF
ncbi:MAG: hypothetical protein E7461_04770 [Ruminococcaceae bacterium]|nr:hypothetical protein [Oscillospiraceae bacterium]